MTASPRDRNREGAGQAKWIEAQMEDWKVEGGREVTGVRACGRGEFGGGETRWRDWGIERGTGGISGREKR